jgi:hypothetical protein
MPSWDSEFSSHQNKNFKQPGFVSVAKCNDGGAFWAKHPAPCANGELLPEVKEAIAIIGSKKTRDSNGDLILATGHNSPQEGLMMIREAVRANVKHIIITHPRLDSADYSPAQIKEAVALGPEIYAEFTSQFGRANADPKMVDEYIESIRAAGVEHAFVSSDTGQLGSEFQPDALAACAKLLRTKGFTEREIDTLLKVNQAKILGIAPPTTRPSAD